MSQPASYAKSFAAAAERAAHQPPAMSAERLCRSLRRMTRQLRQYYLRANARPPEDPVDEWLCDNYYVLEKESKQSIKDIAALGRRAPGDELARFYALFEHALFAELPELCDETMAELLACAERVRPISEHQFSFIPAAVKSVLIRMAHQAVLGQRSEEMIRYAITGIGKLSGIDLEGIIYECSSVERILLEDPAGVYPRMDSDSRKHYRQQVARIAAATRRPEQEIAREMLSLCQSPDAPDDSPRRHIGYPILHHRALTAPRRRRGRIALVLGVLLPALCAALLGAATRSALVGCLTLLPLWEILRTPIWQFAQRGVDVDFVPRMDPKKVEQKPKTAVLVSTLLPSAAAAPALADRLEQLYFSNSDPDLYYCVLADFKEWEFPTDEKDDSQVAACRRMIESLNARYGERFMLFLRGRTYNKTQNRYSGWERKRGAITEFIRFLKGEPVSLHSFVGSRKVLPDIRYIIALDADTNLLYECAQTLVSAAMHPLNRPVVGAGGVVVEGYGVLVPKISPDLASAKATSFSRVMSGTGGVTAYDTRDKDFYQDLFAESIFAGKGLIDVDAFHELLGERFPENLILSHDILEGAYLRTAFVSDVEMTDTAPGSMSSWLARLHRWIRGDWQNIKFIATRYRAHGARYDNPISALDRYKLFDNLRRSLTPLAAAACLAAAPFLPMPQAAVLIGAGILAVTFSALWAAAFSLGTGGLFTLSRKFFTRTLPHAFELIAQGLYQLIMLPAQALVTLDAVVRSLWRSFVSHKKLLEWTTAAQAELRSVTLFSALRRFWLPELLGLAYLLFAVQRYPSLSLVGLCFVALLPVAMVSAKPSAEDGRKLRGKDRETLISYNAAMWRYYEDFANAENHYLPPDNIQQSPVYRVANRTSPTNIGMMLLSVLAARDFDFIDTAGLYLRIDRTLSTVERLATFHGNLYNWYDTLTLDTLKPEFVSTVDSGNFVCSLVALAQGLREFIPENPAFHGLVERVEALVEATDLSVFYNKKKHLFSIGYDVDTGELSGSHYDFLLSEARLTSYYAVARKIVGKKHWGAMIRTMSRCGSYAGAVSWTGTMFEYFMPHLLLPLYEGSLLSEALVYCLYCQKRRVRGMDLPWGISESAFYAFDNNLNYQYKAHGVQKLGVKRYLDKELVISPYSTFITIPTNPNSSMENLGRLRELGVYGRYGFFEAVDFTAERVGAGGLAVTRSYMAHHIGMSMVSSVNALFDGRMQKRFMRDRHMRSAGEFLQEKIAKNTVVYDELTGSESRGEKHERPRMREERREIDPRAPRCTLLTNGELTDILTDTGAGYLKFGEVDLTRRSSDLLRRAQGILTLVRVDGCTLSATRAPFFDDKADYSVEYREQSVTYYARKKQAELGVRCLMHPTISCEQRQIVVKNGSMSKQLAQVMVYFEPVLQAYADYSAHPAFSKLFVGARYDEATRTLTFTRRERDSTSHMYLSVGFLQNLEFSYELQREALMSAPAGLNDLWGFHKKAFSSEGGGAPDPCCALRFDLPVSAGGQAKATLLLCAARTEAEGIAAVISMRRQGLLDEGSAAGSPLLGDSLEGRLGAGILGGLLFGRAAPDDPAAKQQNTLGQSGLWAVGISGDLPIALFEAGRPLERDALESYLRLHASLRGYKVEFDLCILCDGEESRAEILELVAKNSVPNILGNRGGVFVLQTSDTDPATLTLLRAVARHTFTKGHPAPEGAGGEPYRPAELLPISPEPLPAEPALAVGGGVFHEGRFYVDKSSPLPYSHVLANPQFGTLVSDCALGYTWAINSRENKLTPWYNDICTDNTGEMLLLADGGRIFNLTHGARASFSSEDAQYHGRNSNFSSAVSVHVSARGCAKYVDVTLKNRSDSPRAVQLAYYTEPVLGVSRDTASQIQTRVESNALLLHNPYNTAVRCHAALAAPGVAEVRFLCDRAAFLCGQWKRELVEPTDDPCAAVILPLQIEARGTFSCRFALGYGATADAALHMVSSDLGRPEPSPRAGSLHIETPHPALDAYVNDFCPHQILAARIWGRTAFYQCGGAYGFRDQLQDACAYALIDPEILRRQILRCAAVQFDEGDVLHWWHPLPGAGGGTKGVRTRFSDDLLWLPYAVGEYLRLTGDSALLDLPAHYIKAEELLDHEHERYLSPARSELREDVYEHCVRAIERGCRLGEGGLPLMGCGDWNDGMSMVGLGGKGRSVWLALFLSIVLRRFAPICEARGDEVRAAAYRRRSRELLRAVDEHCWDGRWYVRAFFDDGEAMGSSNASECRIDLLPQAFAVLAEMPDQDRVQTALDEVVARLWRRDLHLVQLFDPPFQHSQQQPGYIKAYPAGIRENGGQYTHAAVWLAIALLRCGRVEEGWEMLSQLNPADRCADEALAARYKLEPYAIAADIYWGPGIAGRGGWSTYTGAASWYLRAVYEHLLGLQVRGERLLLTPRLPAAWERAGVRGRIAGTDLEIDFRRGGGTAGLLVDGEAAEWVPLDGGGHRVVVVLAEG